jgi:glutamate carboxypeptidase
MLADLEALVKLESPTEDLQACRDVIGLANEIATRVLGKPAEIRLVGFANS